MTDLLDTGPLDPPPAAAGTATRAPAAESSRAAITPRDAWRKARLPVFLGLVVVLVAVLRTLTYGRVDDSYLDPRSFGGSGSHALAELLRDHGVDVREVDRPSGGADTTVFLPVPELVEPDVVASAASAGDLVLVAPPPDWSAATGTGVRSLRSGIDDVAAPGCAQPDAVAAGEARVRGVVFAAPEGAVVCYRRSFVEVRSGTQRVTFLGTGELMTNDRLDEDGNAALALRLLTRHPTVEWVYPRTFATPEEPESLTDLLPGWVWVLVAQLVVVALLLAFWRGRRLGPVVVEPLPVVVRAAETVEGRARLYLAARARGRAAEALRAGTRDRLVRALGLAPDASRETLVAAVAPRTRGRDGASLDALLYGPPPPDDATLVRLADDLDSLYSEVRDL